MLSQVKRVIRTNYSNPPTHGGAVVAAVLASPELRQLWEDELAGMRDRIRAMRTGLVEKLKATGVTQDFSFIIKAARHVLLHRPDRRASGKTARPNIGIYAVSTGRICVAALNTQEHRLRRRGHRRDPEILITLLCGRIIVSGVRSKVLVEVKRRHDVANSDPSGDWRAEYASSAWPEH